MTRTVPGSTSSSTSTKCEAEYFDLVDFLALIWRARLFVLIGVFFGAWIGFTKSSDQGLPLLFNTYIPLQADPQTTVLLDAVVTNLNETILSPSAIVSIFDNMSLNPRPEIRASAEEIREAHWTFANEHGAPKEGGPGFRISNKNGKLFFETRLPFEDRDGTLSIEFARAVETLLVELRNQGSIEKAAATGSEEQRLKATKQYSQFERLFSSRATQLDEVRIQQSILLSKILLKYKMPLTAEGSTGDVFYRVLGNLVAAGKMPESEAQAHTTEYARLILRSETLEILYQSRLKEASELVAQRASELRPSAEQMTRVVLKVDNETLSKQLKSGEIKSVKDYSRTKLFVIIGAILGCFSGVGFFALTTFLSRERVRLMAIFRGQSKTNG